MKVLFANDYGTPHGGVEIATLHLRDGLRARGHDTRIFSSSAREKHTSSDADVECFGTTGRSRTLLQSANVFAWRKLARVLADFQPDVVHVGMCLTQLSPLILPLLRSRTAIYHAHWLRAICPTGFKMLPDGSLCENPAGHACLRSRCLPLRDWLPLMMQRRLWKRWSGVFDRVVANSEATRSALEEAGVANPMMIPCGVPDRPPTRLMAHVPTALFAGRVTVQKGVQVLVDAWRSVVADLPEARLFIAGDGPERARLERMALPGVKFLGTLSSEELGRLASTACVQVVPSLRSEPFRPATAEAMMRGRAVIASRVGGTPELVRDGVTGSLVNAGDPDALADELAIALRDRSLCERMGERSRRFAEEECSVDLFVDRFVGLYEQLVADSHYPRCKQAI
ncbi:MAG: glycosyltransferase family 4 protein [Planctomycetes bacterium]|nr:glycosyltransferase family 4 protein [Planctomycetota bacterium]